MKWNTVITKNDLPTETGYYLVVIAMKYDHEDQPFISIDKAFFIGRDRTDGYLDFYWDTDNDWDEGQQYIKIERWAHFPSLRDDNWHDCKIKLPEHAGYYLVSIQKPDEERYSDYLWFNGKGCEGLGIIDNFWGFIDDIQNADTLHITHWMEVQI